MTHSSLMAFVDCDRVVQQLDLHGSLASLPATLDCVCCGRRSLCVLPDSRHGGIWSYCASCGFTGDIIELAAAKWNTDIDQAASLVLDNRHAVAIRHQVCRYVEQQRQRQVLLAIWQRCVQNASHATAEQTTLLNHFDIMPHRHRRWATYAAPLVGVATRDLVYQLADALGSRRPALSEFTANWLVQPIGQLPGMLEGFAIASKKQQCSIVSPDSASHRLCCAAGLASTGSGTLLSFSDPWFALAMQLRHLRTQDYLLPIISVGRGGLAIVDNIRQSHRRLVAISRIGGSVSSAVSAACKVDGLVADPINSTKPDHTRLTPESIVTRLLRNSTTVADYIIKRSDQIQEADLRYVIQHVRSVRERIAICNVPHPSMKSIMDTCDQTDTASGITAHDHQLWRGREQLTSGIPVFTKIVDTGDARTTTYHGEVRLIDRVVPFTFSGRRIKTNLLRVINVIVPEFWYSQRAVRDICDYLFHQSPPKRIRGVDRVGWNAERKEMQFPRFSINTNGELKVATGVGKLPTVPQVSTSLSVGRQVYPLVADSVVSRIGWLTATYIAHSLLNAVAGRPVVNLASCGTGFINAMKSAGCCQWSHRLICGDWPTILQVTRYRQDPSLLQTIVEPICVSADTVTGYTLAAHGWTLIHTADTAIPDTVGEAITSAVVHFVGHTLRVSRGYDKLASMYDTYLQLKRWMQSYVAVPLENHLSGSVKAISGRAPWLGFLLLVKYAMDNGLLGSDGDHGKITIKDGILRVPQRTMAEFSTQFGFVPLSIDTVDEALQHAIGMKGVDREPGQEYWLLDYDWFNESTT